MTSEKSKIIINAIGFQSIWWSLAFWQNSALFFVIPVLFLHFYYQPKQLRLKELRFVLIWSLIGILMDTALLNFGVLGFDSNSPFLPLWMLALWAGFTSTLNHSLSWLFKNPYLAVGIGAIGGPSSYWAGMKLGAIGINEANSSLIILVLVWSVFFAACFKYQKTSS